MVGNVKSEKLDRMEKELRERWERKGTVFISKPEVEDYMHASYEELRMMEPESLDAFGYELARYSYYLQGLIGLYHNRMMMCRREIEKLVGRNIKNYSHIYGRDDKWMSAIADSEEATAWKELEDEAYYSWKILEYLPNRLGEIQKAVLYLQKERKSDGSKI
jgi:hypothetical protein